MGRKTVDRVRHKGQKGSSLIEGAFVFLTLLSMILFIMEMGRFLLTQQYIAERARATARMAVVNNWDTTQMKNYLCYGSTTAPNNSSSTTAGMLGISPSKVTPTFLGASTDPDYRLQVTVSGIPVLTFVPMMGNSFHAPPIVATVVAQSFGATN